ncbi:MAG TPA: hypothetical protein VF976_15550 [Gemmatimonadales bacterium]
MPAHPRAYFDLPRVYAEEISAYHRGVLRAPRRCCGSWVYDRFNSRRPTLADYDKSPDGAIITEHPFHWSPRDAFDAAPDTVPDKVPRKTSEQARWAGRSGGAANKARWEKKKAARQKAAARRRRARSAKPSAPHREGPAG